METAIIIAIISSSLTAIITVVNIILGVLQKKKSDRLAIIAQGRIKYLDKIRTANADFVAKTEVPVILVAGEAKSASYAQEISHACATLRTYLKQFYAIEQHILAQMDKLLSACLAQFRNPSKDMAGEITAIRARYDKLYAQYDWAYWIYIQKQYDGTHLDSSADFDAIYAETEKGLSNPDYTWEK